MKEERRSSMPIVPQTYLDAQARQVNQLYSEIAQLKIDNQRLFQENENLRTRLRLIESALNDDDLFKPSPDKEQ